MAIKFNSQMLLNDKPLPVKVCVAKGFIERLKGLLFTKSLSPGHGMYIKPCSEVHSFGMAYALDVVFLDDQLKVIKLDVLPKHSIRMCRGAKSVIELPECSINELGIKLGDHFSFCSELELEEILT